MRRTSLICSATAALFWAILASAQFPPKMGFLWLAASISIRQEATHNSDDSIARIAGRATTGDGALRFLEKLADTVGGRMTGSPQSRAASELILRTLKGAGFDSAHFEEYSFQPRWQRGSAAGRVASPVDQPLVVGSYG